MAATESHQLNRRFPHKFCFNLDARTDRWQRMQDRFARHEIAGVTRFPACDGNNLTPPPNWPKTETKGQFGCPMSHTAIVAQAREAGLPHVMIFEDDVDFDPAFHQKFDLFIHELPDDWDLLLLGGIHQQEPIRVSEHLYRLTRTNSTHAYLLRATIYDAFLDLNRRQPDAVDVQVTHLQQEFRCYCFIPHLAWVAGDYSNTRHRKVNAGWLKESLVLVGAEMRAAEAATTFFLFVDPAKQGDPWRRGVDFVIASYGRQFPASRFVLVEQAELSHYPYLPVNFSNFLLEPSPRRSRDQALRAALAHFPPSDCLVFADCDVFLAHRDIRANILMAARYDFVSGYEYLYDLTPADCERVLNNGGRIDFPAYEQRETPPGSGFCVFSRRGLERAGGWPDPAGWQACLGNLSVFRSPNPAMRLFREDSP